MQFAVVLTFQASYGPTGSRYVELIAYRHYSPKNRYISVTTSTINPTVCQFSPFLTFNRVRSFLRIKMITVVCMMSLSWLCQRLYEDLWSDTMCRIALALSSLRAQGDISLKYQLKLFNW